MLTTGTVTCRLPQKLQDNASASTDSQSTYQDAPQQAGTAHERPAAETNGTHTDLQQEEQDMHAEVQQLAEPKALKAEEASQEQVKQYADQLAEEYE